MRIRRPRRPAAPVLVSIALHVVLGAGLLRVLMVASPLRWLEDVPPPRAEQIGFIALPQQGESNPGRDGGDDRPVTDQPPRPARPLVAPVGTPSTLPAAPASPVAEQGGGSGPRIGAGGPTAGVRPSYNDPRVWAPMGPVVQLPMTPAERLDRTLKSDIMRHNDSLAVATHVPGKLESGDWTVDGPGGKWGVDNQKIRLGKFSLPSAVLALLPLNVQGGQNASAGRDLEAQRAFARIRADIQYQSQRMLNEDELRVAAKRIRERVDRERREKAAQQQPQASPETGPTP